MDNGRIQKALAVALPDGSAAPLRNVSQASSLGGVVTAFSAATTVLDYVGAGSLASGAGTDPAAHGSTRQTKLASREFAAPPQLVVTTTSG